MIDFQQIVDQFDSPIYIYDGQTIVDNYNNFTQAFSVKKLKIHYACKALSNPAILKLLKNEGAGIDCVSLNEVQLALDTGFLPEEIIFTPNSVSEKEYSAAIKLGVHINVDNISMLEWIGIEHPGFPVCIRFNPHIMAGGNKNISVGAIDSKFGISIHQFPLVKRMIKRLDIRVEGIHIHTGSEIADPEIYMRGAELVFEMAREIEGLEYIDFGSGFKVKYKKGDIETDVKHLGRIFSKRFNKFCEEYGKDLVLRFEPGKYLVSNAGFFVCTANVIKQTTACTFIGVDSGFNHLIRPMFYNSYHRIENITNANADKKLYSIVGYICETDTFAHDRLISEVRKGDLLVFHNAGAYCFSMASNYNMRERPAEVLVYNGKNHLIRSRETYKDLLNNVVSVEI